MFEWTGLDLVERLRLWYAIAAVLWLLVLVVFTRLWVRGLQHGGWKQPILLAGIWSAASGAAAAGFYGFTVWFALDNGSLRDAAIEGLPLGSIVAAVAHAAFTIAIMRGDGDQE